MEQNTPPPIPAEAASGTAKTIDEFVNSTTQRDLGQGVFELESPRILEVNLNGKMNTKMGSMIAYLGNVSFKREGMMDQGIGNLLKKAVSGEGMSISYAEGQGKVYLADAGKKIILLKLENDSIVVNGNDVLAFEPSLQHKISMMKKVASMLAGGLFNVRFDGSGLLAITSHYEPLTLRVTPDQPVVTDPNATICWSGNLEPQLKKDMQLKTFLGRGSGESIQMLFQGDGFVVVQPYEELYMQATGG